MARRSGPNGYNFAAIDFETANYARDSACAVGITIVEAERVTARECRLIRPPERAFRFTHIHGLTWEDVRDAPTFAEVWTDLAPALANVDFLAAHNASFDRSVLAACCETYRLRQLPHPFICTVQVARGVWGIYPTKLPDVCQHLGIRLTHHEASSDADACAQIILAAVERGWRPHS